MKKENNPNRRSDPPSGGVYSLKVQKPKILGCVCFFLSFFTMHMAPFIIEHVIEYVEPV